MRRQLTTPSSSSRTLLRQLSGERSAAHGGLGRLPPVYSCRGGGSFCCRCLPHAEAGSPQHNASRSHLRARPAEQRGFQVQYVLFLGCTAWLDVNVRIQASSLISFHVRDGRPRPCTGRLNMSARRFPTPLRIL